MAIIDGDIILELAQYLDILTLLSLSHSCGAAFRASQQYSFWSPHELDSSVGLAAFLPDDHVGPWKSYSSNEIRQAVVGMRDFKKRWDCERVSATRRVHLGTHLSLEVIPGSRWLFSFFRLTSSVFIVDAKTGISTIDDLVVGPDGARWTNKYPVTYSLEPNRILVGCAGENNEDIWSFALFEIILSVNENGGKPYLEAQATQIRRWEKIPEAPMVLMTPEFLVINPGLTEPPVWGVDIYHIPSSRHWKWHRVSEQHKPILVDQWCILTTRGPTETVSIVAIHLPSLLSHPEATHQNLILPEGARLTTGLGWARRTDVLQSRDTSLRRGGSSEYTVMHSDAAHRWAFEVRLEIVPGSIYGNVIWPGTRSTLPSNQTLESELSSQFSTSDGSIAKPLRDGSPAPKRFTSTQKGFDVLVTGFGDKGYIKILRMVDLNEGGHSRMLDWKAPIKIRAGSDATAEMDYHLDEICALRAWNTRVGMLLLERYPMHENVQEYQACWF